MKKSFGLRAAFRAGALLAAVMVLVLMNSKYDVVWAQTQRRFVIASAGAIASRPTTCIANWEMYLATDTHTAYMCNGDGVSWSALSGSAGPTGATGAGVPTGGATAALLLKNSGTDYDTVWSTMNNGAPYLSALGVAASVSSGSWLDAGGYARLLGHDSGSTQTGAAGAGLRLGQTGGICWSNANNDDATMNAGIYSRYQVTAAAATFDFGDCSPNNQSGTINAAHGNFSVDVTAPNLVTLTGIQTITGAKTWSGTAVFNNPVTMNNPLTFGANQSASLSGSTSSWSASYSDALYTFGSALTRNGLSISKITLLGGATDICSWVLGSGAGRTKFTCDHTAGGGGPTDVLTLGAFGGGAGGRGIIQAGVAQAYNQLAVTYSATPAFDAGTGNVFKITLTGNVTSSTLIGTPVAGQMITFLICQDGTGGWTFVWPTNVKGAMTIGGTLSTCSAQQFVFDGTNAYAVAAGVTNQ